MPTAVRMCIVASVLILERQGHDFIPPTFPSSKISEDVYHLVNSMVHFTSSISYPVKPWEGWYLEANWLIVHLRTSRASRGRFHGQLFDSSIPLPFAIKRLEFVPNW
jgi:hypothetical protein